MLNQLFDHCGDEMKMYAHTNVVNSLPIQVFDHNFIFLLTTWLIRLRGLHHLLYIGIILICSSMRAANLARFEYLASITTVGATENELILRHHRSILQDAYPSTLD